MAISKVGIVGFGQMGSGIAQVCAMAGLDVVAREIDQRYIDTGLKRIESSLARVVRSGKITEDAAKSARERVRGTTKLADLADRDLIIEAVIEVIDAKKEVFAELDRVCPQTTIFASNTSSLSITEMSNFCKRPERFLGLHFFNPVPLMKLVEIVRTVRSDATAIAETNAWCMAIGKTVVNCGDSTGFVVNRLLVPYMLDAIRVFEQGLASRDDIDNAMKLGCGYPMGPLFLTDYVGLDTTYYISEIMFDEFKEPRFAAPPLLKRMVLAGRHGRKSGRGFYDWSTTPPS